MSNLVMSTFNFLKFCYPSSTDDFSILKLAIIDKAMIADYDEHVSKHNDNFKNKKYMDSGFDLLTPTDVSFDTLFKTKMIDLGVKAELVTYNVSKNSHKTIPFYLYPRSSISKTPLMLANHTGIIDSGYRGNLKVAMRSMYFDETDSYTVSANSRLVQICDPTLKPIYVVIVDESELSSTERGEGGFGSTGK